MLRDSVWTMLAQSAAGPSGLVAVRLHPESRFNLFAALEQTSGHRFLLMKSGRPHLRLTGPLPSGRGFRVVLVTTPGDPDGSHCVRFELSDASHADVFDVIGNDVLERVLATTDDPQAFSTFVSRIGEWQHFLDELPNDGLSEQAQQGLFAELWFLHKFLLPELGPKRAVEAWAGPKALAKDFHLRGLAIEVKASSAKQHTRFNISSELQLDAGGVQRLILHGLLLERLVGGGTSLVELVSIVRDDIVRLDAGSSVEFADLLLRTGYTDADALHYKARFVVRAERFFDVANDFPRIVGADLRPGVGEVRYTILLSECERHVISDDEVRTLIRATL